MRNPSELRRDWLMMVQMEAMKGDIQDGRGTGVAILAEACNIRTPELQQWLEEQEEAEGLGELAREYVAIMNGHGKNEYEQEWRAEQIKLYERLGIW